MIHPGYTEELIRYKSNKKFSKLNFNNVHYFDTDKSQRKLSFDLESSPCSFLRNTKERSEALQAIGNYVKNKNSLELGLNYSKDSVADVSKSATLAIKNENFENKIVLPKMEVDFSMLTVRSPYAKALATSNKLSEVTLRQQRCRKLSFLISNRRKILSPSNKENDSEHYYDDENATKVNGIDLSPYSVYSRRSLFYNRQKALTSPP